MSLLNMGPRPDSDSGVKPVKEPETHPFLDAVKRLRALLFAVYGLYKLLELLTDDAVAAISSEDILEGTIIALAPQAVKILFKSWYVIVHFAEDASHSASTLRGLRRRALRATKSIHRSAILYIDRRSDKARLPPL